MNKADALKIVLELVARFEEQLPALKNAKYKEHNLRMEFLNPFWEALGGMARTKAKISQVEYSLTY